MKVPKPRVAKPPREIGKALIFPLLDLEHILK
jgi:hypothetical protein